VRLAAERQDVSQILSDGSMAKEDSLGIDMRRIKFPVVKAGRVVFPDKPRCPWCRTREVYEPHSMAILNAGAMRRLGNDRYEMAADTQAFLTLIWHGAHSGGKGRLRDVFATLDIANEAPNGQFDLYFCSTNCLRAFLNYCVDILEQRIASARNRNRRPSMVARKGTRMQRRPQLGSAKGR
jgi:hypothetical protein